MPPQFTLPLLVLITVLLNTVAQLLLKLGSGQQLLNFHLLGGLIAYGFSTLFYILVLGKNNLSVIYPLVIGLTIIATTFTGKIILNEKVLTPHWVGIGLILSGISAIALAKVYSIE
jgi:small multidrug resistance pump